MNKKENKKNKKENNVENKKISKNVDEENQEVKRGFFKTIWYSINKIEKYSELSAEGFGKAFIYFIVLVILVGIVSSCTTVYKSSLEIKNIANYINEKSPELTYKDETLSVDSQEPIKDENEDFGKVIIDTKTEDEQEINKYIEEANNEENSIIILKNKIILKEGTQTASYNYEEIFNEMGITEFNKQDLVNYLTGNSMLRIYCGLFLILFIYAFIISFVNILLYIIFISIIGYLSTIILKLKIRFVAIFNMAIYSITLPTILNIIYIIVNAFFQYRISSFDIMYVLIATIYMISAIFMLKIEFDKKQGEVQKIVEVEKEVKKDQEEKEEKSKTESKKEKQEPEKKETKKRNKKEKSKDEEPTQDDDEPGEAEGSNA